MNWLISLLGGVPATIHKALSTQESSGRQALDDLRQTSEKAVKALQDEAARVSRLLDIAIEDKDIALRSAADVLKATVTTFEEERLTTRKAAVDLEARLATALVEKQSAVEARAHADASRLALQKTALQFQQELGLLRIQMENLQNDLVKAQSEAAYAQQQRDDALALLGTLKAEQAATAAAVDAAPPAVVRAEKKRR